MIEREASYSNTKVSVLAQGDNQFVTTSYRLEKFQPEEALEKRIEEVVAHNSRILSGIRQGASSLGLLINEDEIIQSADLLVYGKNPIYRGNLIYQVTHEKLTP